MKKVLKGIGGLLIGIWLLMAIFSTICLISMNKYGVSEIGKYSLIIIDSDELSSVYEENDLVFVKRTSESKYKVGDYAFFYLENAPDLVFVNYGQIDRIEEADHALDSYYFKDTIISYDKMIGKADGSSVIHVFGLILAIFESRLGFMFLVIFPTLFALVYEIYSVVMEAKRIKDEDDEEDENDKKDTGKSEKKQD